MIQRSGAGLVVLKRAELDALPVLEEPGLPYASKVRARDSNNNVNSRKTHDACLRP